MQTARSNGTDSVGTFPPLLRRRKTIQFPKCIFQKNSRRLSVQKSIHIYSYHLKKYLSLE
jgi:hypothetical protein